MKKHRILAVALLLNIIHGLPALAVGDRDSDIVDFQWLADATGALTLEQVQDAFAAGEFRPLDSNNVNMGYSENDQWFRVAVQGGAQSQWLKLEISNPRLGSVTLYAPDGLGGYDGSSLGVREPFWNRLLPGLSPVFPVRIPEDHTRVFYIRVRNCGSLQFALRLWSFSGHNRHASRELALALMIAGALLALALYNLCVYAYLRQISYLWIGLLFWACTLRQMTAAGTANMFLWPNAPNLAKHAMTFSGLLALFVGTCMANSLLDLGRTAPRAARLNLGLGALAVAAGFFSLTGSTVFLYAMLAFSVAVPLSITACSLYAIRRGSRIALSFLASWGFVLLSSLLVNLAVPGFVPAGLHAEYCLDFGLLAAGLVWSYQLTSQVKVRQLEQRQLLETQVRERTAALEEALEAVRTLGGLLPICSCCKKIRNDQGYWQHVETYLQAHTEADFSHGICPECAEEHYPEYFPRREGHLPPADTLE